MFVSWYVCMCVHACLFVFCLFVCLFVDFSLNYLAVLKLYIFLVSDNFNLDVD